MTGAVPVLLEIHEVSARAARAALADGAPRPLLDQVGLVVPAGEVVAVVGPSGSGKTTLGLAALGAARHGVTLSGRVVLGGTDLLSLPSAARPAARAGRAAHLPQHPETVLDPVRRVGGTLTELASLGHRGRVARKTAAREALASTGLEWETVRRRFPHELSGGQQQRLALASALVTGARLLVLDEPTSGLDPVLVHALGRMVRELADAGAGVLLLSHDLPMVRRTADRVIVLEGGRAVDEGPTAEVLGADRSALGSGAGAEGAGVGSGSGAERFALDPAPAPGLDPAPAPGSWQGAGRHRATRELLAAEHRIGAVKDPGEVSGPGSSPKAVPRRVRGGVAAHGIVVRRRSAVLLVGPVSMAFPPGSRTSLLGPSGSGKTTFGRVLAGLVVPSEGGTTVDGRSLPSRIDRRTVAERRAVQYVHQQSAGSFEGHRPLLDQLADTARLLRGLGREEATAEAIRVAGALGLDGSLLRRVPGQLSGGQLQRGALVRALTARPALLVCDEVTSALDTVSRERVLDTLPELLAPAGTALLFISHDLPAVRALTDESVFFDHVTHRPGTARNGQERPGTAGTARNGRDGQGRQGRPGTLR
ncbi:ATP-binding cassette domain-containing protein [Streptomyces tsukubensis]|uniref:ATP-binding cassette domain-containing protein n=1 Tax=Streptomyces tsukubensis TaxID=83656 RepID=UPI0011810C8A|nr:ATP-binding cassette domain-containing protein [Streptomyces tsukubensis]QFR97871.1 ATP-binding cassette domain-containing protein [Streptomyces tsukubensis]